MDQSPINFNLNAQQIANTCKKALEEFKHQIEAIESLDLSELTFHNTFAAFDQASGTFSDTYYPLSFFSSVSPDKDLRDEAYKCEQEVNPFYVDLYTRDKLYAVLESFKTQGNYQELSSVEKRLVDKTLLAFERSGMNLSPIKRKRFVKLSKQLSELQTEFSKNIAEYSDPTELSKDELEGLPDTFLNQLKKSSEGKYTVTLAYPHFFPIMQNAKKASTRKLIQAKFFKRGGEKNIELFKKALRIRFLLSKIMGYNNHAEFVLEERMAKSPNNVENFLNDLSQKLQPKLKQEIDTLLKLKQKDNPQADSLNDWDWRYYMTQLKKNQYSVDQDTIKQYFPLDTVVSGMFDIYQTLLNVKFEEVKDHTAWHEDVKLFSIYENKSAQPIAYFYMDMFPRENKYAHAAAFTLKSGRNLEDGSYNTPVSSIVANFPKPSVETPSLLPIDQVETLFHEFGHIMHQTLTKSQFAAFSGTRVARDFVEAPSQVLENWVWDEDMLNKFSGHYQNTDEKLPKNLLDKILDSKLADTGLHYSRQLMFATADLKYHMSNGKIDPVNFWKTLQENIFIIPMPEGSLKAAGFGHLMGGYDSAYYGYLWSEVFAADLFTRFQDKGLLDTQSGLDYKKWILETGGSQDADQLIEGFLQRPSNNTAFIKSLGL